MTYPNPSLRPTTLLALSVVLAVLAGCGGGGGGGAPAETDPPAPDPFVFSTTAAGNYLRIDRVGQPAISELLITSKDPYNQGNPSTDVALGFLPEMIINLGGLHAALDDDLAALALTPCTVIGDGTGTCASQGVPLYIPDVLTLDPAAPSAFPNGRQLTDQAMDIMLAIALLDLTVHPANLFANDVAFSASFPYLAPAQ